MRSGRRRQHGTSCSGLPYLLTSLKEAAAQALHRAAWNGDWPELVAALLAADADATAVDGTGRTAHELAVAGGRQQTAALLHAAMNGCAQAN